MKNKIILRADDLGYSEAVNYGIEKSVKSGIINNVGIMLNMDASAHGIQLLKDEPIAFGQHTNFCIGKPVSNPSLIPSLVTESGEFKSSTTYRQATNDFMDFEEALIEIEAQYNEFIGYFGRKPDYIEGHAIASSTFFKALAHFADTHDLTYSGLPSNLGTGSDASIMVNGTQVYMVMDSMNEDYDPYRSFEKMINNRHTDGIDLMVFHPGYLDYYILNNSSLLIPRTQEVEMLNSDKLKKLILNQELTLVKFSDL